MGKVFGKASDDLVRATSKWWTKAGKEAGEVGAETITKHMDEGLQVGKQVSDSYSRMLGGAAEEARSSLNKAMGQVNAELHQIESLRNTANSAPLENLIANYNTQIPSNMLRQYKQLMEAGAAPQDIDKAIGKPIRKFLADKAMSGGKQLQAKRYNLEQAWDTLSEPNGLIKLRQRLNTDLRGSGVENVLGPGIRKSVMQAETAAKYDASNLSTPKFLEKYLELKHMDPEGLKHFMGNANNYQRLLKLRKGMGSKTINKLLESGELSVPGLKTRLIGMTAGGTAKNLGVGVGALAGGAGLLKVYDWFSGNPPSQNAQVAGSISVGLKTLNVTGTGRPIMAEVKSSLSTMTSLASEAQSGLSEENAKDKAQSYVIGMAQEVNDINEALTDWSVVADNSDDPKKAYAIGQKLQTYISQVATSLNNLARQLGVSVDVSKTPDIPAAGARGKDEVSNIQQLLGVKQTGKVDRSTINALRKLEHNFNAKADTQKWTNALVSPSGNIVDYNDLIEAFNIINSY